MRRRSVVRLSITALHVIMRPSIRPPKDRITGLARPSVCLSVCPFAVEVCGKDYFCSHSHKTIPIPIPTNSRDKNLFPFPFFPIPLFPIPIPVTVMQFLEISKAKNRTQSG